MPTATVKPEMKRCLCGKEAIATAYLPMGNVFAGLKEVTKTYHVCAYHAQKARDNGYLVEEGLK